MNHHQIARTCFDSDLRIDHITWLVNAATYLDRDDIERIEDDCTKHPSLHVFADRPNWAWDGEGFTEWVSKQGLYGFVVTVATPKPVRFDDQGNYEHWGFGLTQLVTLYVERLEDVVPLAIEWKEQRMAEWRRQAAANGGDVL